MQFCMHYAFQSEAMARIMLANVTKHLRYGGMFVGTIPDSHLLTCVMSLLFGRQLVQNLCSSREARMLNLQRPAKCAAG